MEIKYFKDLIKTKLYQDNKISKYRNNVLTDYNRIYYYHIRKCAGTSINSIFLKLNTENKNLYGPLCEKKVGALTYEDKVYVMGNM